MISSPAYNEFLIRLIGAFPDKGDTDLARIAIASAPELCSGKKLNAVRTAIVYIRQNRKADKKDIAIAKKLLKDLPKREISEYDLAEMRLQTKPIRNK